MPPAMADAIVASRAGGDIVYYLAQHPDEHWRIAALPDGQQKREIKKIEKLLDECEY